LKVAPKCEEAVKELVQISALERYTQNNVHSFTAGSSYNAHAQWRGAKSVVRNLKHSNG